MVIEGRDPLHLYRTPPPRHVLMPFSVRFPVFDFERPTVRSCRPQPIGFQATISAPHMHAHALEVLSPAIPAEGGKVLDVGCGSGFLTAAFSRLVGEDGVVYGMVSERERERW